ncbi:SWIM zinc finger family protein [Rudaea sp. 3F27F6]|uniref:SWIM zinc finger family protein n=1 Tax=Rudaea sp. 3F27F6 TaxID=2502208 RepID=UPI0010F4FA96|nr:SWIM zinc finger family protein [Rudaea sp. 3F27F6]
MAWYDVYRAYDDDTLTALANPGLLRRAAKDVEAEKIRWIEQGVDCGRIFADGQQVEIDTRGPKHARCDCPAPDICKHILSAALWLRAMALVAATTPEAEGNDKAALANHDPLAEILALDAAPLFKAAGIVNVRRAAATPAGAVEWRVQGNNVVIELPDLGATCRWIGGAGFTGMVSELPAGEQKAVHLIALVALRSALSHPLAWPSNVMPQANSPEPARVGDSERSFLAQVEAVLRELIAGGLSHIGELTSSRLLALNMSARGEGLPRLAALLRNLGGTIDLLAKRDHRADEHDALTLMARIQALCEALSHAEGDQLNALRGRLRRDFEKFDSSPELLPVGAYWWQTRGGARGLTLALWCHDEARLLQATLARPDGSDSAFTRISAWNAHAFWPGAGTAEHVSRTVLKLEHPRLAEDGRLALGGVTRAQVDPMWGVDDARLKTVGCDDWLQLTERLRAESGLMDDMQDVVLLRPSATRAPVLDEVRQCLDWLLQDAHGRWLRVGIPVDHAQRERLENLERIHARGAPIRTVLVRVERTNANCDLIPVAVLSTAQKKLEVLSLDFAVEPTRKTSLGGRILKLFESRQKQTTAPALAESTLARRLLTPIMDVLETQAATGRMPLTELQQLLLGEGLRNIRAVGLDTLDGLLAAHIDRPSAVSLLRLAFVSNLTLAFDGLSLQE